jgi:hypothetical protein
MVYEMFFNTTSQLSEWLNLANNFENLGPQVQNYLPTRHVRMQNK